jgi:hypothetical protein
MQPIYLSMDLQPLWALAAFSVSYYIQSCYDFLEGRLDRRKAATYTQNKANTEWTNIHVSSEIGTHDTRLRAVGRGSCFRPRRHCDRRFMQVQISASEDEYFNLASPFLHTRARMGTISRTEKFNFYNYFKLYRIFVMFVTINFERKFPHSIKKLSYLPITTRKKQNWCPQKWQCRGSLRYVVSLQISLNAESSNVQFAWTPARDCSQVSTVIRYAFIGANHSTYTHYTGNETHI